MKSRAAAVSVLVLAIVVVLGIWFGPAAQASCVGPSVAVSPDQASKGEQIDITGEFYWDRCNDVIRCTIYTPSPAPGTPSPSPTQSCDSPEPAQPLDDIRIDFVQGSNVWVLGTVDADAQGKITLESAVPEDAEFGDAIIRACHGQTECAHPEAEIRVAGVLGLPTTGGNGMGMALAGLMVLAIGVGFRVLARPSRLSV